MKRYSKRGIDWIFIFLMIVAALFRFWALDSIPPGLSHDEANNVHDAVSVLNGARTFYFPVAQGKEPLYIYSVAGFMALLGKTPWVMRFTSAIWGMVLILATYAWAKRAFDRPVALVAAAGLGICFWPVSTARLGLRAIALPVLFTAFTFLFWRISNWFNRQKGASSAANGGNNKTAAGYYTTLLCGIVLGLCLYTYLAARLIFLIILPFYGFLFLFRRPVWQEKSRHYLLVLLTALVVMAPMVFYLRAHPSAEIRIDQLSRPLRLFLEGDPSILLERVKEAVGIFSFKGDTFIPYNIPGKPLLEPLLGLFFYAGLVIALWEWKKPAYFYSLLWFLVGMIPAMVTGAEAGNLRLMLIQPVIFVFPAIAWARVYRWIAGLVGKWKIALRPVNWFSLGTAAIVIYSSTVTYRDYFNIWAEDPDVWVHYHVDLVEITRTIQQYPGQSIGISAFYPGEYHDPRVVEAYLGQNEERLRWFDGRTSLVVPSGDESLLFLPVKLPLSPIIEGSVQSTMTKIGQIALREDDFDPGFSIYRIDSPPDFGTGGNTQEIKLGDQLLFIGAEPSPVSPHAGQTLELLSRWKIVGRLPDDLDGKFFVHLLDQNGRIVAQDDRLDVPSWDWHPGDCFYQVFRLVLPEDIPEGKYRLVLGGYTVADRVDTVLAGREPDPAMPRLPVIIDGKPAGDSIELAPISILNGG